MAQSTETNEFENLLDYLKRSRGFDFSAYKRTTLQRRIEKRMQMLKIAKFSDYIDYLEVQPSEFSMLFNTILINVTSFFRDPQTWEFLQSDIVPKLLEGRQSGEPLRVWSAGCASGEEAYTIAMVLAEAVGIEQFHERVKIYATDVDEEELARARTGIYAEKQMVDVPEALREKYFEPLGDRYIFHRELRRSVIFGRNDLIQDAPISRVDLLVCRNTLMYFNTEAQSRILARFHFALNDGGVFLLGRAEMLLTHQHMFLPVDLKRRIFTKVVKKNARERLSMMGLANNGGNNAHAGGDGQPIVADDIRLRELGFDFDVVAQVLVDRAGILIALNERARALFGLGPAEIGKPISELEILYRPVELRSWIEQAISDRRPMVLRDVTWTPSTGGDNEPQVFDVHVMPLIDAGSVQGVKVTFQNVTRAKKLADELQQSRHELETAYEELQTTNEELQSTVEEMETTNEELQSTNEEMETMNEELQSTNEELQTINAELSDRTGELNQVNLYLESILTSLDSGVAVLNGKLEVQTWNERCHDMWGLRSDEVIGKHFFNLDIGLPVEQLKPCIRAAMSEKGATERTTLSATNRRGKAFECKVTCTPMAGDGGVARGVILLMEG